MRVLCFTIAAVLTVNIASALESTAGAQSVQSNQVGLEAKIDATNAALSAAYNLMNAKLKKVMDCNASNTFYNSTTDACAGSATPRLVRTTQVAYTDMGSSNGQQTGLHDFCAVTGVYQNGNNGWVYMNPSAPNSAGKRNYTVVSTCPNVKNQNCGSGSLSIMVDCFDFQ